MPFSKRRSGSAKQSKSEETISQRSLKLDDEASVGKEAEDKKHSDLPTVKRSTSQGTVSTLSVNLTRVSVETEDALRGTKSKTSAKKDGPQTPKAQIAKEGKKSTGSKKSEVAVTPPPTSVRRSSRAPVPSSRFKDMEVDSPRFAKKRAHASSASEESDVEQEVTKKPAKKVKTSNIYKESFEVSEEKAVGLTSSPLKQVVVEMQKVVKSTMKSPLKKNSPQRASETLKQTSILDKKAPDKLSTRKSVDDITTGSLMDVEDEEMSITGVTGEEDDVNANVPVSVEEMIERSLQEGKIDKEDLEGNAVNVAVKEPEPDRSTQEPESEVTEADNSDVTSKSDVPSDKSVNHGITGKSDILADADESDKLAETSQLDTPGVSSKLDTSSNTVEIDTSEVVKVEANIAAVEKPAHLHFGRQEVTITERSGETIAVVTIPPRLGESSTDASLTSDEASASSSHPLNEVVSVIPNAQSGHTIVTAKMVSSSTPAGVSTLNLEARRFSSLMKPKNRAVNPAKGHGRVIPRSEQQAIRGGIIKPTPALVPPKQSANSSKGSVTYSLLPPLPQAVDTTVTSPKGNQKVIVVKQKPAEAFSGTNFTNIKGSLGSLSISQSAGKSSPGGSTVVHVKKAAGSALTASDLEAVLKALSGSPLSESTKQSEVKAGEDEELETGQDIVPVALETVDESTAVIQSEEQSELIVTHNLQDVETVEASQQEEVQAGMEEEEVDAFEAIEQAASEIKETEKDQTVVEDEESTVSQISGIKEVESSDIELPAMKVDEASGIEIDPDADKEVVAAEETQTEEAKEDACDSVTQPTPALPVESALYQALQALEPQQMAEEVAEATHIEGQAVAEELNGGETDGDHVSNDTTEKDGEKSVLVDSWKIKGETIKVMDNGIEYDVRIVGPEDVTEEVVDESENAEQAPAEIDTTAELTVKEEPLDTSTVQLDTSSVDDMGMQTSGTQTLYSAGSDKSHTVQEMATVYDKDGQKKQIYYVSVFPGKGVLSRVKSNQGARLTHASWVLSENGMYCCGKCNYKTDRKANFYKHRRLHIGAKPHVCPVCDYKAGTSSNLKRHMGIHKDIREHKCEICGVCFRQKIHLERHIKYKHEEKSVQCPLCDYVCANEQPDLKMHMKRKHSGKTGEILHCPECQVEVGSKKDLKQHMKFHKDGPELKLFCKECSFVTDCQSRLRRHAAIHSKLKPFQCGMCNYRGAQKEHVLRHLRTQHKIEVKRESRKPWKSRKQKDEEDSKDKADFTSGDKIFACNHCTMRFAKLINLYKHLHTQHSDIMPPETSGNYYCVVCDFATTTKKNLLVHMRRHNMTDQTPPTHVYSCVLCRYVNPKRRNLFQHMRKKHNIDVSNSGEEETDAQVGVTTDSNIASMIKVEDFNPNESTNIDNSESIATLVIDTAMDTAQVVPNNTASSLLHHQQHAVDALEGLQALAEQAGLVDNAIEEQVHTDGDTETSSNTTTVTALPTTATLTDTAGGIVEVINGVDAQEHHQLLQQVEDGTIVAVEAGGDNSGETAMIVEEVDSQEAAEAVISGAAETEGGEATVAGVELSEEQLSSLRHGDMVEMEGQLYMVELSQDPAQPDRQLLSFLPVQTSSLVQE